LSRSLNVDGVSELPHKRVFLFYLATNMPDNKTSSTGLPVNS
jgi:hypothetical protein